jgi:hypothetical protein
MLLSACTGLETIKPLPVAATPTVTSPQPTPSPVQLGQQLCPATPQARLHTYIAETAAISGERLTISGIVYASDATTPLSGVLIDIWRAGAEPMNDPYPPALFSGRILTDKAGYYEFTTMRPAGQHEPNLYYRLSYQEFCPVLMQLHLLAETQPRHPSSNGASRYSPQGEMTGPVLRNPVDIILPVPPPKP